MHSRKELKPVIFLTAVLLAVGIACYSAFSAPEPEEPVRIMYKGKAGKVLFDHKTHLNDYGLDCMDCHHNIDDDETYSCSDCHEQEMDEGDIMNKTDAMHAQCISCHRENDAGPVECASCHAMAD